MAIHEFLAGFESLLCSKGYGIPNGTVTSAESRTLFNILMRITFLITEGA